MQTPQTQVAPPQFDPLDQFAGWWVRQPFAVPPTPNGGTTRFGGVSVITLYQSGEYQVQLAVCDPNSEITDHSHPGVELIKVYLTGQIYLRVNGVPIVTQERIDEVVKSGGSMHSMLMRIGPNDTHGAKIGPEGGAFITIQRHLGKMKSLGLCWNGEPLDENHAKALQASQEA